MAIQHILSCFKSFIAHGVLIAASTIAAGYTGIAQTNKPLPKKIVIAHVNVITMDSAGTVLYNATVSITGNRIESINGPAPKNAIVIEGKGKWVLPGLVDMHVHLPTDFYLGSKLPGQAPDIVFNTIANGVTTIFNLNASVASFIQRKQIQSGNVIGPRMALAALIDGGAGSGRIANTPEQGRQTVRNAKAEGYEFIKLYSKLSIETFTAIVDEAGNEHLNTVGHIPNAFQGKLDQAFVPHFDMVAHAEEFSKHAKDFSQDEANRFARLAKANGTWLSPTLTAMDWIASESRSLERLKASPAIQYVHPLLQSKWLTANSYNMGATTQQSEYFERMVKFHFILVSAFNRAGVPIVAGTDAGVSGVVGGFALLDELELLVQAGMTPAEVLASATRLPAQWLGLESEIGSVEPGKLADLILLDANPLTDINNIRKRAGVFVNGHWLARPVLAAMLADLSRRNTASKKQFDWKKTMGK